MLALDLVPPQPLKPGSEFRNSIFLSEVSRRVSRLACCSVQAKQRVPPASQVALTFRSFYLPNNQNTHRLVFSMTSLFAFLYLK
jgi:hypothetical protein